LFFLFPQVNILIPTGRVPTPAGDFCSLEKTRFSGQRRKNAAPSPEIKSHIEKTISGRTYCAPEIFKNFKGGK